MIERYEMTPEGDLVITWEAETPEDGVELKELALQIVRDGVPAGESLTVGSDDDEVTIDG